MCSTLLVRLALDEREGRIGSGAVGWRWRLWGRRTPVLGYVGEERHGQTTVGGRDSKSLVIERGANQPEMSL